MWNPVMWSSKQWQACMLYVKGAGRRHNQYGCHSGCKTRSLSGGKRWYGSWQTVCFGLSFLGPEIRGQKNNSRVNLLCFQNRNSYTGCEKLKPTFSLHGCLKMLRMSVWYYIHIFLLSISVSVIHVFYLSVLPNIHIFLLSISVSVIHVFYLSVLPNIHVFN